MEGSVKTNYGARVVNLETSGSIRPSRASLLASVYLAITEYFQNNYERPTTTGREGTYNPEKMTWESGDGGQHSQRCNARKIAEFGTQGDAPENY